MSKPIAFNYGTYEKALEQIHDLEEEIKTLEAKVEKQTWEVMKLKKENTNLTIHVRILTENLKAARGDK